MLINCLDICVVTPVSYVLFFLLFFEASQDLSKRLAELKARRLEAQKLNHKDVVAEKERNKLPPNWENKKSRLEWEEQEDTFKQNCLEKGLDPDRMQALELRADVAEKIEAKKRRKQNPNTGYADDEASFRKYKRLTGQIKPDLAAYEKEKEKM